MMMITSEFLGFSWKFSGGKSAKNIPNGGKSAKNSPKLKKTINTSRCNGEIRLPRFFNTPPVLIHG